MTPQEIRDRREAKRPDLEGIQTGPNGEIEDHPIDAIKFAELKGVTPDGTIINVLTQDEKEKLLKMIKHGEFTQKEAAFLKYLILASGSNTYGNLEDIGAMIGATSPTTGGQPLSKQAAFGELRRIMTVVAKRLGKLKPGKTVDDVIKWIDMTRKVNKIISDMKAKADRERIKAEKAAMREFWATYADLNRTRKAAGLPRKSLADLQNDIDNYVNADGSRGLKSRGEKVRLPVQSVNYHGGSDVIDRKEGRYNDK